MGFPKSLDEQLDVIFAARQRLAASRPWGEETTSTRVDNILEASHLGRDQEESG